MIYDVRGYVIYDVRGDMYDVIGDVTMGKEIVDSKLVQLFLQLLPGQASDAVAGRFKCKKFGET